MNNKKLIIDEIVEIGDEIIKFTHSGREKDVAVVGYYDTICELFNYLIKNTSSMFVCGELQPHEWDDYEDAYCLEYDNEEIWISKMADLECDDEKYTMPCGDIIYVEEDFWDEYVKQLGSENAIEFGFSDVNKDDEFEAKICMDNDECGFCFCLDDDNKNIHTKFKYRGDNKLTQDQIFTIINQHFN